MRKKAVQQGRSERRGESYSVPYVEPLSDARTPLADFFRILPVQPAISWGMSRPMRASLKTGFSFGLTSGVITTLGLMVGLHAGTHSMPAVLGGILTIAVADAMSDALGIHIAEESKNHGNTSEIWESTMATFAAKFMIAGTFAIPVLFMPLDLAIVASLVWGLSLLAVLSYGLAREQRVPPWKVIGEHVVIGLCVVAMTHYLGEWVRGRFT